MSNLTNSNKRKNIVMQLQHNLKLINKTTQMSINKVAIGGGDLTKRDLQEIKAVLEIYKNRIETAIEEVELLNNIKEK